MDIRETEYERSHPDIHDSVNIIKYHFRLSGGLQEKLRSKRKKSMKNKMNKMKKYIKIKKKKLLKIQNFKRECRI